LFHQVHRSFDYAGRFASESACSAHDDRQKLKGITIDGIHAFDTCEFG